ncbi:G2/mitotic-specific cyclin-B [Bradysia coprophila]|uniref:G2/mitotic-specific cyclin-B n=1 Tax=Bradysia coprophila TaxID=38358 RepID=UPI00187D9256|nr:G2/mitotic-specific cyclin-B [Bradysia coprophila]
MPLTRANKVNENDGIANNNAKRIVTRSKSTAPNGGRLALGEVSNNLVKAEPSTRPDTALKPLVNLKDVKPKVDSYWKKNEAPTAKRSNSQLSPPKLVTTKSVRFAKAEVPQLVTIKPNAAQTKKTDAAIPNRPIRRQESILSRVQSLRNAIAQSSKAVSSPASRSSQKYDETMAHSSDMLAHGVDDIDKNDAGNLNLESEYVKDIYNYLHHLEKKFAIPENYLSAQREVTPKMRTVLIDWLNEVHLQFHLFTETYYLTVGIIDRYLNEYTVTSRKNLQLVGVAAMFLACKYEEMYPPMLKDFVFITDDTYSASQIMTMEQHILRKLDFDLSAPSVIHFARRFSKAANISQLEHTMSKYFIELASIDYSMVQYRPSIIAASAVFMTLKLRSPHLSNDKLWSANMQFYTKYKLAELRPVISSLAKIVLNAPKAKEKAVVTKFSTKSYEKVSVRPEIYGPVMASFCSFGSD